MASSIVYIVTETIYLEYSSVGTWNVFASLQTAKDAIEELCNGYAPKYAWQDEWTEFNLLNHFWERHASGSFDTLITWKILEMEVCETVDDAIYKKKLPYSKLVTT